MSRQVIDRYRDLDTLKRCYRPRYGLRHRDRTTNYGQRQAD